MFFDAGFINVETDEVYDLPAGADSQTIITVNGQEIGSLTELPFDGDIKVIEHFPISEYSTTINIDFESNWIFSKYNVVVTLAGTVLGTLPHGESGSYQVKLPAGSYDLVFSSEKESDVSGTVTLTVNSDTPQGQINKANILAGNYASNTSANESESNVEDNTTNTSTSTSSENGTEKYTKHVKGNSGVSATAQKMIQQYRENIIMINRDIIKDVNMLFMGVY